MGLKQQPKITVNYILSQIDESQIFFAYFGSFVLGKTYNSVFREDKNASTGFYISESGKIIYNDIATSEKLDCFAFVAKKFGITYGKALVKVACDFGLMACEGVKIFDKDLITKSQLISEHIKKDTDIKIQPDYWTTSYLEFWDKFSISKEELEENGIYPVKKLYINDVLIPNFTKNVRYAFTLKHEDHLYKKIYSPYAENKKFKWISNTPLYLPYGFHDLPYLSETLIITKAQKDRIIFKKYFTDVIGIQNESPAALRDKTLNYLKKRYKTIYINCDIDDAGQNATKYFMEKGCKPLTLPLSLREKGIKDCADFVKQYGLKRFEDFLQYSKLK